MCFHSNFVLLLFIFVAFITCLSFCLRKQILSANWQKDARKWIKLVLRNIQIIVLDILFHWRVLTSFLKWFYIYYDRFALNSAITPKSTQDSDLQLCSHGCAKESRRRQKVTCGFDKSIQNRTKEHKILQKTKRRQTF